MSGFAGSVGGETAAEGTVAEEASGASTVSASGSETEAARDAFSVEGDMIEPESGFGVEAGALAPLAFAPEDFATVDFAVADFPVADFAGAVFFAVDSAAAEPMSADFFDPADFDVPWLPAVLPPVLPEVDVVVAALVGVLLAPFDDVVSAAFFAGAESEASAVFSGDLAVEVSVAVPAFALRRRDDCMEAAGSLRAARGAFASSAP